MFQKYSLKYSITTEFYPCNKSFVFAKSGTETCRESCFFSFSDKTTMIYLETGDVPIRFSLPQMQNLGTLELDP